MFAGIPAPSTTQLPQALEIGAPSGTLMKEWNNIGKQKLRRWLWTTEPDTMNYSKGFRAPKRVHKLAGIFSGKGGPRGKQTAARGRSVQPRRSTPYHYGPFESGRFPRLPAAYGSDGGKLKADSSRRAVGATNFHPTSPRNSQQTKS